MLADRSKNWLDAMDATRGVRLFCSYSHKDEELRDELEKHLSTLIRSGVIASWHDRRIDPGREWAREIDRHLDAAQIILLLVSADFLASDYCYELEMKRAVERHKEGSAHAIPVILREVDWKAAPFAGLQALPKDGKPVTSWANRDEAYADIARGIRQTASAFHGATSEAEAGASDPALPPEATMVTSTNRLADRSERSLLSERDGPKVTADMLRLLRETAAAAEKTANDYASVRARLREREVDLAGLRWRLKKDDQEYVEELERIYREESDVFARAVTDLHRVQRQVATVQDAVVALSEELRSQDPTVIKVVVELDMARYSDIAKDLQNRESPQAVRELARQVRDFVTRSIRSVGAAVAKTYWKSTGDGAILVYDNPDQASRFAETLHKTAEAYNRGKRAHLEQRHFRVGIATGPVVFEMESESSPDVEGAEIAGMAISNAVRLEAACRTGEVLVDEATWSQLSSDQKTRYGAQEIVRGKRKELVPAHRRAVVAPAPWDKA